MIAYSDAAFQNAAKGASCGGHMIALTVPKLREQHVTEKCSLIREENVLLSVVLHVSFHFNVGGYSLLQQEDLQQTKEQKA